MILMNKNIETLWFDDDYTTMKILNNDFLPYMLKDYVKDSTTVSFKDTLTHMAVLKDFLINRLLPVKNANAKAILSSGSFSLSEKTFERLDTAKFCRSVTVTDNFWLKNDDENLTFSDINLREKNLSDMLFDIAILGKTMTVKRELLIPSLVLKGMFPKVFMKDNNGLFIIKTDKYADNISTKSELMVSDILDLSNVNHIPYKSYTQNDILFAKCECFCNDSFSFVEAVSVMDWCAHTNQNFLNYVKENFYTDFAKMCVIDYVLANTDRHLENWGFIVDNATNEITQMAPLFDHNQALISDALGSDIDELIYPPTNLNMKESALQYFPISDLQLDKNILPSKALSRLKILESVF